MKSKRDREEACYICGHYHNYEGGEPCSVCGHVMAACERKNNEAVIPTAVIPGFLYLGSYDTASRSELLKAMAITHILNTVPSCQALFKNTFQYHTVSSTPPDFKECYEFIERASQQQNGKILVYCMSGTSKSPAVIMAYLMRARGWRLLECYKWVKDKRPNININAEDTKRLMDEELAIHGSCSVPQGFAAVDRGAAAGVPFGQPGTSASASQAPASTSAPVFSGPFGQPQWTMHTNADMAVAFGGATAGGSDGPGPGGGAPGLPFVFGGAAAPAAQNGDPNSEMEQ